MDYGIIAVIIFGAIGGILHQYVEGNIKNSWKNIRRGLIFGGAGAFIAMYLLNMAIVGFSGYLQLVAGGLIFGYTGDSITINYAKRKLAGYQKLLDVDDILTQMDLSMSNKSNTESTNENKTNEEDESKNEPFHSILEKL